MANRKAAARKAWETRCRNRHREALERECRRVRDLEVKHAKLWAESYLPTLFEAGANGPQHFLENSAAWALLYVTVSRSRQIRDELKNARAWIERWRKQLGLPDELPEETTGGGDVIPFRPRLRAVPAEGTAL